MGFSVNQYWPYAPYHEMIVTLSYGTRALLLFFSVAALTLLICGVPVHLRHFALLGGLFILPFLVLMSGYVPYPTTITPAQFAGYQVKMLPVLSGVSLIIAFFLLRKMPPLPLVLILLLMALTLGGYAFIGLLPDEQKRNATETLIQACLIGYLFLLTLYIRLRPILFCPKTITSADSPRVKCTIGARWAARISSIWLTRPWPLVTLLLLVLILLSMLAGKFLNFGSLDLLTPPGIRVIVF